MRFPVYLKLGSILAFVVVVLLLLLALVPAALAAPEEVDLGPYRVSFDLNNNADYTVSLEEPVKADNDSLTYGLTVRGDAGLIGVYVTGNRDLRDVGYEANRLLVSEFLREVGCSDINITEEVIDGRVAALGGGKQPSGAVIFSASYSPDGSKEAETYLGSVNCRLFSTAPLEDTANLLRTIHVEKAARVGTTVPDGNVSGQSSGQPEDGGVPAPGDG